ncbi:hypothetical protein BU16DRAFT_598881 [Lophium mytilinum]|uniref:Uncharacterized protein n=1 Tax=Lophium mytilinum TaxID=390894 RepID=A0A6A6R9I0_9PEZI|nr:hypothetical protein BU16DRAFT_598881 [Lophium mytilinum]
MNPPTTPNVSRRPSPASPSSIITVIRWRAPAVVPQNDGTEPLSSSAPREVPAEEEPRNESPQTSSSPHNDNVNPEHPSPSAPSETASWWDSQLVAWLQAKKALKEKVEKLREEMAKLRDEIVRLKMEKEDLKRENHELEDHGNYMQGVRKGLWNDTIEGDYQLRKARKEVTELRGRLEKMEGEREKQAESRDA